MTTDRPRYHVTDPRGPKCEDPECRQLHINWVRHYPDGTKEYVEREDE